MTIDIQTLATILIIMHSGSAVFMGFVLKRQYKLFSHDITLDDTRYEAGDINRIKRFRLGLFLLSSVVLLGNVVPIVIDLITILGDNAVNRAPQVHTVSILYAVSNALTALISAYLISTLYRIAKGVNDPNELVQKDLQRDK
jgi:hypothetical protein